MNKTKNVAEMFGLELLEEFNIKGIEETLLPYGSDCVNIYRFNDENKDNPVEFLVDKTWVSARNVLDSLITGFHEVVKIPWKPEDGDTYWHLNLYGEVARNTWNGDWYDLTHYKANNCFKTEKWAEENKEIVIKELQDYYENN